jgi:CRISPR/Cas system-associated endonuclease Cas1
MLMRNSTRSERVKFYKTSTRLELIRIFFSSKKLNLHAILRGNTKMGETGKSHMMNKPYNNATIQ